VFAMGRGNVCVFKEYEGLYYVDRDYLDYYVPIDGEADEGGFYGDIENIDNYEWDYFISQSYYEDFIYEFVDAFTKRFKSFTKTGKEYGTIMESNLFEIEIEDNQWSYAVKLIQKECWYDNHLEGLQKKHHENYLKGMKEILLDLFPSIGTYAGAWCHGTITR
jgi:hypothetical protein